MTQEPRRCPECSVCEGMTHHWLDNFEHEDENGDPVEDLDAPGYCCKHCDALGEMCDTCDGDGCDDCLYEGVVLVNREGGAA